MNVRADFATDMFSGCANVLDIIFSKKNEYLVNEINNEKTEGKLNKFAKVTFLN